MNSTNIREENYKLRYEVSLRMNQCVHSFWIAIAIWVVLSPPGFSKEASKQWVLAPVYFVTDRVPIKENGKIKKFIDYGQAVSNYSAGIRYVALPRRPDIEKTWSHLEAIGWIDEEHFPDLAAEKKKLGARVVADNAAKLLSDYDLSDSQVTKEIKKLPAFSGGGENATGELVIYVHGFYNDFDESTAGAAELSSYFKRPVLVYCWTTPKVQVKPNSLKIPLTMLKIPNLTPKIWQSYRESEVTHQHGQDKFTALIQAMSMSFQPGKLILVAHSMGSRLLDQALVCRHGYFEGVTDDKKFKAVIFSNPDLDGKYFASHAEEISEQTNSLRVFFVAHDGAMEVSRFLHGAHDRLGSPNKGIFAELRKSHVSLIDMSKLDKSHLGVIGHSMPSWLLANVYKYGTVDASQTNYRELRPNGDDSLIVIERVKKKGR